MFAYKCASIFLCPMSTFITREGFYHQHQIVQFVRMFLAVRDSERWQEPPCNGDKTSKTNMHLFSINSFLFLAKISISNSISIWNWKPFCVINKFASHNEMLKCLPQLEQSNLHIKQKMLTKAGKYGVRFSPTFFTQLEHCENEIGSFLVKIANEISFIKTTLRCRFT